MRIVIFSSKKVINRRYVRKGFARPAAYALLLMLITAFSTPYRAQPVPVPQLDRPAFNSNDMQPIFDLAGRSTTETGWEWIVSQGRAVLTAQWEAYVDAQIAAELSSVNNQDYFQTDAEYKDYLLRELLVQKQSVRNQWEIDAELAIQAERDPFLAALAVQRGRELEEDSDRGINRGEAAANDENATVDAELARQMAVWEQEFIANMERGIYEYDTALGQLAMDHQSLLDQIAQREAEFEQDRLRIEAYETDVRNGISDTLVSMRAYLQSNGLFHAENCDPNTNVCTTDMTRFNAAGDDLNTMINAIQDKLDNDAPLSVIAQMMYDYLDAQEQAAVANQTMWQNRIEGDINWSSAPHPVHLNSGRGGQCAYNSGSVPMHYDIHNEACRQNLVDWAAINANEPISAYLDVVQGRGQDRMKDYLKRTAGLIGDVTRIDSIDLCGQGQGVSGVGGGGGLGVNRLCYSNRGNEAFVKSNVSDRSRVRLGIRTGPRFWTDSYAEHDFDLKVNFHWYDPQAETNAVRWQGYVDDIRPVLGHWRDNLLPAITTWEAQTDAFDADLDAFKTEAAQQRADAVADFETSRDHLISERTRWIEAMRLQYREGTRDWAAFQQKLERANAENANAANEPFSYANAPTVTSIPTTAASTLAQYQNAATNRDLSFLDKESSAPDYALVSNLGNEFRNLGLGLKQLTLATAIHNQINDEREQIINQQIAMITGVDGVTVDSNGTQEQLDGYQVTVLDNGTIRATRQIHSGRAVRTGGDGTSADHYQTELTEQMIEIAPPPTVAMPDTGSMFAEWDTRSVMQEYGANRQETFEQMTDYMQGSQDRLMDSMKAAALNQKRFYEDRSSQIAAAIAYKNSKKGGLGGFLKSVAMAMFTGGVDLNTAVSQQANQMFTNEIAEAFGIPSGIVSGVLTSGLPVHEAFNDWVETDLRDEMISEAAKATGWPETIVGAFADGADMQDAWQDYTQELVNTEIAKRVDDPALQQMLMQTLQGMRDRLEKKEARMEAGRFRAEDYATGGVTMAMRYADAEGMNFSDSSIPQLKILGTMQNAYGMLRDGADQKAVLAEMVEGTFNAGYGVAGMEVDLEYSDRGGFSGSASISVPLGMGPQLASVSAQEGRGVTHSETISGADFARQFGSRTVFDGFKGLVTDTMGDLMSIPSGLIKHWQGDADLHKQLEQSLAAKMEEEAYKAFEASSGIPATIIKGMADKQPLDTVWKDYTDELIMDELANQANCDDKTGIDLQACQKLAAGLQEKFQQWKKERAKKEAQKWRPEDAAGGLTYVWRNAQHDEDLGFAVTVAETAGGYVANTAGNVLLPPAGGTLIYAGYMATKQAYMGALNARKEDRGKAALAGLASGGLNALLDMTKAGEMLDVNLSYNSRDGFGASVDVGYKLSENVKVGMALDFNEGAGGFDGGRLSAGYQPQSGFGVNGAINFDRSGNYQGASLGGGYREGGFNGGLSMNFNQEHRFTGGSLTGSYGEGKHNVSGNLAFDELGEMNSVSVDYAYDADRQQGSGENQRYETWYKPGGGLTFNRDGSFALRAKNTIGVNDRYRHGLSGAEGWMQNQLNFGADGQYAGIDYDFGAEAITQNDKDVVANLNADILRNREALPPAILAEYDLMQARIRAELGTVGDHTEGQIQADLEMKWNARIAAMLAGGEIDAETAETMR
ncbi:MAG: TIGR04388 family protein, partial [Leptospiraceae bacterium]|nr:TIGR04388 family protein [Leptospiraceae bacterium]